MKANLKLFWSRGRERNAGDWFSPLIVARMSGREVTYAPPHRCDLVAVGSVLHRLDKSHRLHRLGLRRTLDVWGAGSLRPEDRLHGEHRLHAVRGRLSLAQCADRQEAIEPVLGDPGLLADMLLDQLPAKSQAITVIPHLTDRGHADVSDFSAAHPSARVLDITMPVPELLGVIARSELVLSSSLHGLVFADSLGVPNQWFVAGHGLIGGRHKFDDYYSVFGLHPEPLRLGNFDRARLEYRRPGLDVAKQRLIDSFPFR